MKKKERFKKIIEHEDISIENWLFALWVSNVFMALTLSVLYSIAIDNSIIMFIYILFTLFSMIACSLAKKRVVYWVKE